MKITLHNAEGILTFTIDPIPERELFMKFEQLWASGREGSLVRPEVEFLMPGLFRFAKPVEEEARYSQMFRQAWELAAQQLEEARRGK